MVSPRGLLAAVSACLIAVQAVQAQPFEDHYPRQDQDAARTIFADRIVLCSESGAVTKAHVSEFLRRVFPQYRHPAISDGAHAPLDPSLTTVYVYTGVVPRTRGLMTHCVSAFPEGLKPIAETIEATRRAVGRKPDFCKGQFMRRQPLCHDGGPNVTSASSVERGKNWRLIVSFSNVSAVETRRRLFVGLFGFDYDFCEKQFDCSFLD